MVVTTIVLTLLGIFVLVGVCALCIHAETKLSGQEYDERQSIERHKGYRFGFWVGLFGQMICLLATVLCCDGEADSKIQGVIRVTALLLPILGCFTYWTIKDVMLARWQHPTAAGVGFLLMGLAQFYNAFADRKIAGIKLYCIVLGIGLAYIALLYFLQLLRKNRE